MSPNIIDESALSIDVVPHDEDKSTSSHFVAIPASPQDKQNLDDSIDLTSPGLLINQAHPLEKSTWFGIITANWLNPIISLGAKRHLEEHDVWPLAVSDTCVELLAPFQKHWKYTPTVSIEDKETPKGRNWFFQPFGIALLKTLRSKILLQALAFLFYVFLSTAQPFLVQSILQYLENKPTTLGIDQGWILVLLLTIVSFIAVTSLNLGFYTGSRTGINMRSIAMNQVYEKALRLNSTSRQNTTTGEIVTMMSTDAERIFECAVMGQWIWIGPISLLISSALITYLMGPLPALLGFLVSLSTVLISFYVAVKIGDARTKLVAMTEERVKVTSEAIQGIRVMKFYGWEASMLKKIEHLRAREIRILRRFHFLRVFNNSFLFLSPVFMAGAIIAAYVALGNDLDVATVFTLLAFINVGRLGVAILPVAAGATSECIVAIHRIHAFLVLDERMDIVKQEPSREPISSSRSSPDPSSIIDIHNATFTWTTTTSSQKHKTQDSCWQLHNIELSIKKGSLVMIVGEVGSGKSSLLSAVLGEMHLHSGQLEIRRPPGSTLAYVAQDPWIRHDTVKHNIIFDKEFMMKHDDREWYDQVLDAAQLRPDLAQLTSGDLTEIGERGLNLSGGQKARVSIARALYRRSAEPVLLDDPLSAVDVHVANAIFREAICGLWATHTRLLVLNAHYHMLPHADLIVVMSEGRVSDVGTYDEVVARHAQYRVVVPDIHVHDMVSKDRKTKTTHDDIPVSTTSILDQQSSSCSASPPLVNHDDSPAQHLMQAEERVRGAVSLKIYISFFEHFGSSHGVMTVMCIVLAFLLSQILRISVDVWQGEWAEAAEAETPKEAGQYHYEVIYWILIVVTSVTIISRGFIFISICVKCAQALHDAMMRRVFAAPINLFFDITPVGRILNGFSRDVDLMDSLLPEYLLQYLQTTFVVLSAMVVCAFASPYLALAYLPMTMLFVMTKRYFDKSSRELKRLEGVTRSPIFSAFSETLQGIATIRAFELTQTFIHRTQEAIDTNTRFLFTFWAASRWLALRLDWLSVLLIAIVTSCLIWTKGSLDPALAGLSLVYSLTLTTILQWAVRMANMTENIMTAVERLLYYETIVSELSTSKDASSSRQPFDDKWPGSGTLVFHNVQLRYRPELDLVLRGLSFDVASGEKIGIVGRTGSGKSSIMIALFRIAEMESGSAILLDGVDVATVPLSVLRSNLAIIPQDPVLFSGSLRENLDPFHEHSNQDLWHVLANIHLDEVVRHMWLQQQQQSQSSQSRSEIDIQELQTLHENDAPLSLDIAEQGENLSAGQRQLLCIGRALLRDARVVVMDEATASVDHHTDTLIQETVRETFVTQTVLTIAHRLDTIIHNDRILVLENGRIAEYDTPQTLLQTPGSVFQSLVKEAGIAEGSKAEDA